MSEITIEFRGKQITASRGRGQTGGDPATSAGEQDLWYITIGGTALTKFSALPGDSEETVRTQVLQWLSDHPDMLDRDQIVLGGG
jgi:hypothetical protein